jgi:hypothetical protein
MLAKLSRSSPCAKYAQLFRGADGSGRSGSNAESGPGFLWATVGKNRRDGVQDADESISAVSGTETEVQRCGTEEFIM